MLPQKLVPPEIFPRSDFDFLSYLGGLVVIGDRGDDGLEPLELPPPHAPVVLPDDVPGPNLGGTATSSWPPRVSRDLGRGHCGWNVWGRILLRAKRFKTISKSLRLEMVLKLNNIFNISRKNFAGTTKRPEVKLPTHGYNLKRSNLR